MNDDLNRARNLIADSGYLLTLTGSEFLQKVGSKPFAVRMDCGTATAPKNWPP